MRTKLVNRYYCDFCKKSGGSIYWMRRHEERCTNNPNRVCGMCAIDGSVLQKSMKELSDALLAGGMDGLREAAEGCPACIFAAIRQTNTEEMSEDACLEVFRFNFKDECRKWWETFNELYPRYEGVGL